MIKDLDITEIKFLPISQENLVLSLDRLTRFKYPETKYYRVFTDILCKYLLYPKLTKKEIQNLEPSVLKSFIEVIWNDSVYKYTGKISFDTNLNDIVKQDVFDNYNISDAVKTLVETNLNISGVLSLLKESADYSDLPINLKYLLKIQENNIDRTVLREKFNLLFPIEKVVLCEGITEEILLPEFARHCGFDFYKNGIKLLGAGGKSQVAKLYCELKEELKIPVFILLDADAKSTADIIEPVLRRCDSIYLIKHGEFEDIFSLNLIKRTINNRYKNICESTISDFRHNGPMTKVLTEFFRVHELGDFQKAEFAKELALNIKYDTDLTEEIRQIVQQIKVFI